MKIINKVNFTAEVSSNHSRDIKRCMDFIEKAVKSHQSGNIWLNLD